MGCRFATRTERTGARPSAKWLKTGRELVATLGEEAFREAVEAWLPRAGKAVPTRLQKIREE